ncbi:MAG TPA: metallophosphoesterase, partial [Verrucomicrobiae bacterium]|nr:metallophosphoesterase [Verrucomicrobiae bacterium]
VRYGTTPGTFTSTVNDPVATTEHVVNVTGLQPLTRYYYEVGTGTAFFVGDANDFFETAPVAGTILPIRMWVIGDSGTASASAAAVRDAYINFAGTRHTDIWLMLGDNAYNSGTDTEYQNAVFNFYPSLLQNTTLWSTRGNHESDVGGAGSTYYNIFTLPRNAEAGGTASGTEAYYSFEYGNVHFICLDAMGSSRSATGPMATWLRNDLAAVMQDWIIAFWHHPPYTKGSHNSDAEVELIEMRQNMLPILEDGGVDLVLCGHSHSYERSFLLDGHYGTSTTLTSAMKLNSGSGREDGTGAYIKSTFGIAPHQGAVYAVAGSSGQISGGTLNHPAMFISLNNLGSMVLDLNSNRLDAKFLRENGTIADYFTIIKGDSGSGTAPPVPQNLSATPGNAQVSLTWGTSSGAASYNVKRSTTSGGPYTTIASPATTSYLDTAVVNGTTYYYVVSAVNSNGESANSTQVSATPSAPTVPAAPTNLTLSTTKKKIRLNWTDNSNNETGFKIERSTDGVNFTQIATVAANIATYQNNVTSGVRYYYRVRATNAVGDSGYSNTANIVAK